jgi:hypothetical protein
MNQYPIKIYGASFCLPAVDITIMFRAIRLAFLTAKLMGEL